MRPVVPSLVALTVGSLLSLPAAAATLLQVGRLIDSVGDAPRTAVTVVVDGEKIQAVENGYRKPAAGDTVIDLRDCTLTAGWWDMHVHITAEYSPSSVVKGFQENEADVALEGALYAERTLQAGFTSVRDLGSEFGSAIALRNAINRGYVPGPRIYAAGRSISTVGGQNIRGVARMLPAGPAPAGRFRCGSRRASRGRSSSSCATTRRPSTGTGCWTAWPGRSCPTRRA